MNILKSTIGLFLLVIAVSCAAPDIDKVASDYCECKKKQHFEGEVIGEQCIKEYELKYKNVTASKSEIKKLELLMDQCNKQYAAKTNNTGASVQYAANEYCVCVQLEATNDTIESKFCFEEWNQKYKDQKLNDNEQKEFVRIITECTGITDSITTSENLTINMIAEEYCSCIELGAQLDTIGSVACYQALSMQYQGLQLTQEEEINLKGLLKDCADVAVKSE
ncbi:MAG: hypothetical protein ACI8Q1_002851 [Parvicella sp.]|jgi:hypothetical protein